MCNKNTSRLVKRSRTRTRKPKYLSLSKHIKTSPNPNLPFKAMPRQLKTLFPLHPENLVDDRSSGDENVAMLFDSDAGDASLTTLLQTSSSDQDESLSPSSYGQEMSPIYDDDESLVRSAMKRNRERDASEEKWVCYSEVVEEVTSTSSSREWQNSNNNDNKKKKRKKMMIKKKKKKVETTSSSGNTSTNTTLNSNSKSLSLALKLDYEEILNAWSDKGSLFIQAGDHFPSSPQTVPDLQYDLPGLMDGWGSSSANLWNVPESGGLNVKEETEAKDGSKLGQREASVLRYKEKRQSRLFSKRIRYEVRKLNAEKRPRMKGRFVKIS